MTDYEVEVHLWATQRNNARPDAWNDLTIWQPSSLRQWAAGFFSPFSRLSEADRRPAPEQSLYTYTDPNGTST